MPPKVPKPKPPVSTKATTSTSGTASKPKPLPTDLPIHTFSNTDTFITFLSQNHSAAPGIYLKLAKKSSGIPSITAPEAVEVALCFGWIDGRANALDKDYWLVRYTPRRAKSIWSKKNVKTVQRLIEDGRMTDAGMQAVDAAKEDGRWERAYDGPAGIEVPGDLESVLDENGNEDAKRVFGGLSKSERYAVLHRLQTGAAARRREKIEGLVRTLKGKAMDSRVEKAVIKNVKAGKASKSVDGEGSVLRSSRQTRSRTRTES